MVMSSASSAELALDDDLSLVAYTICLQNQDIYQSKLRELADGKDTVFMSQQGSPVLPVKSGEVIYLFTCVKIPAVIRIDDTQCCQELPVAVDGQSLYMKSLLR